MKVRIIKMTLFIRMETPNKVRILHFSKMLTGQLWNCVLNYFYIILVAKTMKNVLEKQEAIKNDTSRGIRLTKNRLLIVYSKKRAFLSYRQARNVSRENF